MSRSSICSASLCVREQRDQRSRKALLEILGQFGLNDKNITERNVNFDLSGKSYEDIRDTVTAMLSFLDPTRKSCLTYFGEDGVIRTLIVTNGQLLCS